MNCLPNPYLPLPKAGNASLRQDHVGNVQRQRGVGHVVDIAVEIRAAEVASHLEIDLRLYRLHPVGDKYRKDRARIDRGDVRPALSWPNEPSVR